MATGFMRLHFMGVLLAATVGGASWCPPAAAIDVALIGVIGDKAAVLAVDGGEPKTVKVGQRWNNISVLAVEKQRAVIQVDGVKRSLALGQHYRSAQAAGAGRQSVTLAADGAGHFSSDGSINGVSVRFLVDTGASLIAIPGPEAERLGIDYRKGARGTASTAGGSVPVYRVRFDTVKVGNIELNGVDGIVMERGLPIPLLGMSFLNRVDMRREGDVMTLTRRF
jgi:aspartyl protease family protein